MWFRNLRIYRVIDAEDITAENLEARLERNRFQPCARLATSGEGWISPCAELLPEQAPLLTHTVNGCIMLALRQDNKVMPAGIIRDMVNEKAGEIQLSQQRKVNRREKNRLRDEIIQDLLPRALCRTVKTYAYLVPRDGLLLVDTSAPQRAEQLISRLRDSLGKLTVVPLAIKTSPATVMTEWVMKQSLPADLAFGQDCVLQDPRQASSVIRCSKIDIGGSELAAHLDAGRQVTRLELVWDGALRFMLDSDMTWRRIRFEDMQDEPALDGAGDDALSRFDNDFAMMTLVFARCLQRLLKICGGEDHGAYPAGEKAA